MSVSFSKSLPDRVIEATIRLTLSDGCYQTETHRDKKVAHWSRVNDRASVACFESRTPTRCSPRHNSTQLLRGLQRLDRTHRAGRAAVIVESFMIIPSRDTVLT